MPAWGHVVIGVGLLVVTGVLDATRPFNRDWSMFYWLPLFYAGYNLRGRLEVTLQMAVILAVFLVPLAFRPELLRGGGSVNRSLGMGAGLLVIVLMWQRRRYISALQRANDELEGKVAARTCELEETNKQLRTEIAERKQAEEDARRHLMQLAHVNRVNTMGEMAAGIAHELNQPLSAIAGFTYAARSSLEQDASPASGRLKSLLAEIESQSLRAGEIVKRVRRLVRKAAPQSGSVDPNELIEATLALVQTEARIERIEFVRRLAPDVPLLSIDAVQVQQVILNLVRNAMEAVSEMDASRRQIIVESVASKPGEIEISVRDFGPGLSAVALDRAFEAFFTTKPHGLGMGLAISRSIIEAHGGQLRFESKAGEGARFYFSLPLPEKEPVNGVRPAGCRPCRR